jgi:hypothetical protein
MLNNKSINENWTIFKNNILKAWDKITPSELDAHQGDLRAIRRLIIAKYGDNGKVIRDINYIYQASLLQCYPNQQKQENSSQNNLDGSQHSKMTSHKGVHIPLGRKTSSALQNSSAKAASTPSN